MLEQATRRPTILFGVTSAQSLKLLGKIPFTMAKSGWDVHVVSASGPESLSVDLSGISHHVIEMERAPSPAKDLKAIGLWLRLLRGIQPDIVSIGTPKAALLGLISARVLQIPVRVYMLRGLRLEGSRGGWRVTLHLFEWLTSSSSTHIIAVSQSLKASYLALRLSGNRKITVLGRGSSHGVDVQRFEPQAHLMSSHKNASLLAARKEGRAIVAFVGRFGRDKGAQTLVACKQALEELSIDHEFVIVGEIEDSPHYMDAMNSTGKPVVRILGSEDLSSLYPLFDLLLLPSKREGLPNVVLEAAASGVPSIVTNATGAVDSVVSGETGIVVPLGDEDAFVRAAIELLSNRTRAATMGEAARWWVRDHFDAEKVSQQHFEFYSSLVSAEKW